MNAKYKPIVLYILESYIDEIMAESGFKRRSNSLIYNRTIGTTKQKLDMVCYSHPPYYAGSLLHIYPYMSVYFQEINKIAENMISDVNGALSDIIRKHTYRQPIQMKPFDTTQWILMTDAKEEVDAVAEKIGMFLKQYIISFFDDLETVDDYIDTYLQQDKRISKNDNYYFFLASAYAYKEHSCNSEITPIE
ncbi:MAG: hypothetical protein NC548_63915 [Lachnospiraceae bacterium]|nr:hypothetical protein [Lachnospiraceae bacterium]